MEKRKEKERKNELDEGSRINTQAFNKVKEMARLRRSIRRLKLEAKSRESRKDQDEEGRSCTAKGIVIKVEIKDSRERKTKFADESPEARVDEESVMMDNEMLMDDLKSEREDPKEVRFRLLNLRETEPTGNEKSNRSCWTTMKHRKSVPPHAKTLQECSDVGKKCEEEQMMPMTQNDMRIQSLPTMGGTICAGHSKLRKDADFDSANSDCFDRISMKQNTVESNWRNLLEELYHDKKYFDYVIRTKTPTEGDIFAKALDGLEFLYERAVFWEQQEPIPPRPIPGVLKMYRKNIQSLRTATPKTVSTERSTCIPSTKVGGLKKRADNSLANGTNPDERHTDKEMSDQPKESTENQLERDTIPLTYFDFKSEKSNDFKFEQDKTSLSHLRKREALRNRKDMRIKVNTDAWEPITLTSLKDERFSKNQSNSASVIETHVKKDPWHNAASNNYDSYKAENSHESAQWASRKPLALNRTRIASSFRRKKDLYSQPRAKSAGINAIFEGGDG
ncbi:hypothetical protein ACJMK2_030854 [Sinanodonta woodiana]|uniref:Uncharacterized protein n=1 Tax=Sinanodonta woodiana TaxID=1069815 RepID=A0ABD3WX15_SINWO